MSNIRPSNISLEVGDAKQEDWYPQLKIMKWNNESNLSMRLIPTSEMECNESHFYHRDDVKDGGHEFEFLLKEKPKSNVMNFTLRFKEATFHYQPELTQEEIDDGCYRPENVVGSYAVYGNKKNNEYQTGKICHIYRPEAVDNKGVKSWCDLNIQGEIATITIPQDFLDNATYPIIVDPTFGYTTIGGTDSTPGTKESIWALGPHSASTSGDVTSMSAYLKNANGLAFTLGFYDDDTTFPNDLQVDSAGGNAGADGWQTQNMDSDTAITSGTPYWLSIHFDNAAITCVFDSVGGFNRERKENVTYVGGTMVDPWPGDSINSSSREYSIYATYTETGDGTNIKINIGDAWKPVSAMKINIGDAWKDVVAVKQNIGDDWKDVF